jgi:hypothetical protein
MYLYNGERGTEADEARDDETEVTRADDEMRGTDVDELTTDVELYCADSCCCS